MKTKTTQQIVDEETKGLHNCCLTDGIKRKNKQWIDFDDLISQLEDWNNIQGLDLCEVIDKLMVIKSEKLRDEIKNED